MFNFNLISKYYRLTYLLQFYFNTTTVMWDPTKTEQKSLYSNTNCIIPEI